MVRSAEVIAPASEATGLARDDHFARFYLDDETLIQSVAEYVRLGLGEGAAAIVIATAGHSRLLANRWAEWQLDVPAYCRSGQLTLLDASETLARFARNGRPDRDRFLASVGEVVGKATRQFGRAVAFGEMVSLLWASGNAASAVELESLWNELRQKCRFSLYCGYSLRDCTAGQHDAAFKDVCDAHRFVIPAETFPTPPLEQGKTIAQLQRQALALEVTLERDRKLQQSIAHMAAIVESSDDAIISKDMEGIIQSWNAGAERIFGYAPEEVIGQPVSIILPPERLEEEQRILATLRRGERIDHFETQRLTKNGERVEISLTVSPIRDADGLVIGASKIARDITVRKRTKELLHERDRALRTANVRLQDSMLKLRNSEQRLKEEAEALHKLNDWSARLWRSRNLDQGINEMLDGVIGFLRADKGHVQLLQPGGFLTIEAQRGFDREFLEFFQEVSAQDDSACGRALRAGAPVIIEDVEADEAYAPMRAIARSSGYRAVISVPLISGEGTAHGILSTHFARVHRPTEEDMHRLALYANHASDFIRRCKAECALRDNEQALRDADRRKDEFLALLAHELRNPLAPIRYALAANRKGQRTVEQLMSTNEIIERQVTHMSRLLDDLLDVARITSGKLELKKAPTELTSILAAAIETARPLLDAKHHTLSLDFPKEAVRFEADSVRLAQVFSNLLINAAKYTDRNGHIRLSAVRDAREIVVHVRDNGIGVSEEMIPRLIEMFSQAHSVLERTEGGLGLGLALVRGLVALHDGTVSVKSEGAGHGSEFTVRLPWETPMDETRQSEVQHEARVDGGLRILIVDDNRDAADTCSGLLQLCGHHVQTAYGAHQAIALAEAFRPHAMLLDIGLPDLNGYHVARRIREAPWGQTMLLVAITGWGQQDDRQRALEAGFDHHLPKPVAPEVIESVLQTAQLAVKERTAIAT